MADNRYIAEDAAQWVEVDYEPLPAVNDCRAALEDGAPLAHANAESNIAARFPVKVGDADRAFAGAAHVFREKIYQHRGGAFFIECRGIVARTFFESADGQKLYRERMTKLLGTAFKPDALVARVNDLAAKIKPAAARDAVETKAFDSAVAQLRDGITQRAKFLEDELKKPAK